jgi:hypothetical protein
MISSIEKSTQKEVELFYGVIRGTDFFRTDDE